MHENLSKIFKYGSKAIDSIAASNRIINYIEGCKLANHNKLAETDYGEWMITT